MNKYKICVYAISKNQEKLVDQWMDRLTNTDLVIVLDVGSTDLTVEKLRSRGALVYQEVIEPFRMDIARNKLLKFIPNDIELCLSLDLNELIDMNWRDTIEELWSEKTTHGSVILHEINDNISKQYRVEKIHVKDAFYWEYPVYEQLKFIGNQLDESIIQFDFIVETKSKNSVYVENPLLLLEFASLENPHDSMISFLLGCEYRINQKWIESIVTLNRFLENFNTSNKIEEHVAMYFIADCYRNLNDTTRAKQWIFKSFSNNPISRESLLYLALIAYHDQDWPLLLMSCDLALQIEVKPSHKYVELKAWGNVFDEFLAIAYYNLGAYEKAFKHIQVAINYSPTLSRLLETRKLIEKRII